MNNSEAGLQHPESHWADLPHDPEAKYEDEEEDLEEEEAHHKATAETQNALPSNPEIEFGTLTFGTWFTIDSNGVTFEKTSDRDARIVAGSDRLLGISYQFGLLKPVHIVPRLTAYNPYRKASE